MPFDSFGPSRYDELFHVSMPAGWAVVGSMTKYGINRGYIHCCRIVRTPKPDTFLIYLLVRTR